MRRLLACVSIAVIVVGLWADGPLPRPASASAVPPGTGPCPASGHVAAVDFAFVPSVKSIAQGGLIAWDFCTTTGHNVVDATSMNLFDSGSGVLGDPPFEFTYVAAGKYPYVCTFHTGMAGTITVKVDAQPQSGLLTTTFVLTWASTSAPTGFVYDVQIRRPNSGHWRSWMRGVRLPKHAFRADRGTGAYRFRSRLRFVGNGHADWSPTATIHVH